MTSRPYIRRHFLLEGERACELYSRFAEPEPLIDFHSHLPAKEIAEDRRFENLAEIWLEGDHSKWRAMRLNGVPEQLITGAAPDRDKFQAWAETVPQLLRNPLYDWTHMELADPLGITDKLLCGETAEDIWERGRERLAHPELSARGLLRHFRVEVACTTDDPLDSLEHHEAIAKDNGIATRVLPTFRPDKALAIENTGEWNAYIDKLASRTGMEIRSFEDLVSALEKRAEHFAGRGCRLSDHGIDEIYADDYSAGEVENIFRTARDNKWVGLHQPRLFRAACLYELGGIYHRLGWAMQLHVGAMRNVNTRAFQNLGADSGFDAIGAPPMAKPLAKFLDRLSARNRLPRMVLYNLHPKDIEAIAALAGAFPEEGVPGKIQYGPAWRFLDHQRGIERLLNALSQSGLLGRFIGMTTDSRSFLSYRRHDYFRRVLCNLLGDEMERELIPDSMETVGGVVRRLSSPNARSWFGF